MTLLRRLAVIMTLSLVLAGQGFVVGTGFQLRAESPMGGTGETYIPDPQAQDDEPVSEPATPAPKVVPPIGTAAPALAPGKVMQPVANMPLPPRRPFSEQVVQPPAATQPPKAEDPADAPAEAEAPGEGEMPPAEAQRATPAEIEAEESKAPEPMLVEKQTDAVNIACLKPELMKIVHQAGEHFGGTPVITSGQRNRGRRGSFHRKCMAADFIIPGIERARLAKYLRALPQAGGVGTYCHTKSVHIDIGEPRNWYQCGFRFRFSQR